MPLPRASSADAQLNHILDSLFISSERNICMSDLNFLSAVSMAGQVRQKKIFPLDLVEAHLKQIERLNSSLNAFVHLDADRARRDARAAEATIMRGKHRVHSMEWRSASRARSTWPVCDARPEPGCAPASSPAKMRRW